MYRVQQLAVGVLAQVECGTTLTDALAKVFRECTQLTSSERGALQDICYGVLRFYARLRFSLRKLVPQPLPHAHTERLLLVALYQLFYTRAAIYTVVNEAVKVAAKQAHGRFKGLCNAVLRNALRQNTSLLTGIEHDEEAYYNHPAWWVKALQQAYPVQWQAILEVSNQRPPLVLRVNLRKTTVDAVLGELLSLGIDARALGHTAIHVIQPRSVHELPGFLEGHISVQDCGAQQAALRFDLHDGLRVLDACAAPGGKTCHILEKADVELTAVDISPRRLVLVQENLDRLDLEARLVAADVTQPDAWWDGRLFDRILADVPCSAAGVVRRHPDIKWLRSVEEVTQLTQQQAHIMDVLWSMLAVHGKMLYATCSIFPEENEMQLANFLTRHPEAKCMEQDQLLPSETHDGFYYALLEKQ